MIEHPQALPPAHRLPAEDELRIALSEDFFNVQGTLGIFEEAKEDQNGPFASYMRRMLTNLLMLEKKMYEHRQESEEHAKSLKHVAYLTRLFSRIMYKPTLANGADKEDIQEWERERPLYTIDRKVEYKDADTTKKATLTVLYEGRGAAGTPESAWKMVMTIIPQYTYGPGFEAYAGISPQELVKNAAYRKATRLDGITQILAAKEEWERTQKGKLGITLELFEPPDAETALTQVRVFPNQKEDGLNMTAPLANGGNIEVDCILSKRTKEGCDPIQDVTAFATSIGQPVIGRNGSKK